MSLLNLEPFLGPFFPPRFTFWGRNYIFHFVGLLRIIAVEYLCRLMKREDFSFYFFKENCEVHRPNCITHVWYNHTCHAKLNLDTGTLVLWWCIGKTLFPSVDWHLPRTNRLVIWILFHAHLWLRGTSTQERQDSVVIHFKWNAQPLYLNPTILKKSAHIS